ncbi:MAG: hypothetical protein QGF74_01495 [Candidatus Nanoarchaeia archaeon]|jgi:hypothetical protein|nr:hypothetical protein [Candidatus Nanoarchaeia archaeon]|tara:strand:- start:13010 stop:13285 length:276 start_codon:yes stop_codon:yes gene_type:complete
MVELGGNIKLEGFDSIDSSSLIIVKKIVGNYTRKIMDNNQEYKGLTISLNNPNDYELKAQLIIGEKTHNSESVNNNLFMALNSVLNDLASI